MNVTERCAGNVARSARYASLPAPGGSWRHYRGNDYVVVSTAVHTETQEIMVVYRRANLRAHFDSGEQLFVRPIRMWRQRVTDPSGATVARFRSCGGAADAVDRDRDSADGGDGR